MRERPTLDWIPLVLLAGLTVGLRPHAPPPPPPVAQASPYEQLLDQVAGVLARADARYRAGDPAAAAEQVRDVPGAFGYGTLAEQYAQLAAARAIALDPKSTPIEAFEALRRARTLDMALGGALADEQAGWMRKIAPRAARMYGDMRDREGAALARLTAEMID